ncbi:cupin domain-containing protein [bacterium]|nr:cupin domain-containing protein [bacterium]
MNEKVNIKDKLSLFSETWTPKIIGEINDSYVKIFKAKGEFVWHQHENEDEFFLVISGELSIKMRDREILLKEGEFFIMPRGVEHLPYAKEEACVLLFEKKEVINTGNVDSEKRVEAPEWI